MYVPDNEVAKSDSELAEALGIFDILMNMLVEFGPFRAPQTHSKRYP
jgi:hypothetical protein